MKRDSAKVVVVVTDSDAAATMGNYLVGKGYAVEIQSDPDKALARCKANAPDLVVVDDHLPGMEGLQLVAELLRFSWTTSAILVSQLDEESVHERAEGLGILGHVTNHSDLGGLDTLLRKFERLGDGNSDS